MHLDMMYKNCEIQEETLQSLRGVGIELLAIFLSFI
jgi:hypothetical protein